MTLARRTFGALIRMSVFLVLVMVALFIITSQVGCAGSTARDTTMFPAMRDQWPSIREDASDGIAAKVADGRLSPERAVSRREALNRFDGHMERLTPRPTTP